MFVSGQTLLNNNNIISNNSILYGSYIELKPNKYKLTISGEILIVKKYHWIYTLKKIMMKSLNL